MIDNMCMYVSYSTQYEIYKDKHHETVVVGGCESSTRYHMMFVFINLILRRVGGRWMMLVIGDGRGAEARWGEAMEGGRDGT